MNLIMSFPVFYIYMRRESLLIYVNTKQCEIEGIALECYSEIQNPRTKVCSGWMGFLEQKKAVWLQALWFPQP